MVCLGEMPTALWAAQEPLQSLETVERGGVFVRMMEGLSGLQPTPHRYDRRAPSKGSPYRTAPHGFELASKKGHLGATDQTHERRDEHQTAP